VNPSDALAQHRMARAHAALHEADLLIEQQHFSGALNRVYYAAFYAARAMLATRNLDSSRHSGVIESRREYRRAVNVSRPSEVSLSHNGSG
jgi:uncharacterized protein (UPF0332 family)